MRNFLKKMSDCINTIRLYPVGFIEKTKLNFSYL